MINRGLPEDIVKCLDANRCMKLIIYAEKKQFFIPCVIIKDVFNHIQKFGCHSNVKQRDKYRKI